MIAIGNYINVFSDDRNNDYDVFVILNEPNDQPTPEEVDIIGREVKAIYDSFSPDKRREAQEVLDELDLNCLDYGCQVVERR